MSDYDERHHNNRRQNEFEERFREETAAEVVPIERNVRSESEKPLAEDQPENREIDSKSSVGIFALVLSILSLLIMPIILGAAGIIAGEIGREIGR